MRKQPYYCEERPQTGLLGAESLKDPGLIVSVKSSCSWETFPDLTARRGGGGSSLSCAQVGSFAKSPVKHTEAPQREQLPSPGESTER